MKATLQTFLLFSFVLLGGCRTSRPAQILSHGTLYEDADAYAAWPSLVRAGNGDLLLAFTRTERHVSPDGAIVLMRSHDDGHTWTGPTVLYDSPIDDRESGFTVLPDGTILAHLWSTHWTREVYEASYAPHYPPDVLQRWIAQVEQPAYRAADSLHGGWVSTSTDNGHTWSVPVRGPDSIHGGIALQDGTLLVASYRTHEGGVGVYKAASASSPWHHVATVRSPHPGRLRFGEPHVVQLPSGRILMMIRPTAIPYDDRAEFLYLWETYSDDGGQTWAPPFETPLWGFPPHLTLLHDGHVLATYGHRRPPYGQRAALSPDGLTWDPDQEIILRDDAPDGDLGYPASLEIAPDTILTVYYQKPPQPPGGGHKVDIVGTRWVVPRR